ncbi:MAG: hypothetical protein ACYS8I_17120 [Planctomycetota bacterium]
MPAREKIYGWHPGWEGRRVLPTGAEPGWPSGRGRLRNAIPAAKRAKSANRALAVVKEKSGEKAGE